MMIIGMVILPFVLNARYMKAGLDVSNSTSEPGLIPSLEVAAELPEHSQEGNSLEKNYPDLLEKNIGD
jgi:hypothetical protein